VAPETTATVPVAAIVVFSAAVVPIAVLGAAPVVVASETSAAIAAAIPLVAGIVFFAAAVPVATAVAIPLATSVILAFVAAAAVAISPSFVAGIAVFAARQGLDLRDRARCAACRQRSGRQARDQQFDRIASGCPGQHPCPPVESSTIHCPFSFACGEDRLACDPSSAYSPSRPRHP
jgi:hypothetical protein